LFEEIRKRTPLYFAEEFFFVQQFENDCRRPLAPLCEGAEGCCRKRKTEILYHREMFFET
jgi:hypothetical protein